MEKISLKTKIIYSLGNFGISIINGTFLSYILYFYLDKAFIGFAEGGFIMGIALAVGRIVDAIVNPIVGSKSDNFRSRFGRRKPFIMMGIIPLLILYILLWTPPIRSGHIAVSVYVLIIISIFDAIFTFLVVPVYALLPEIAISSEDRLSVSMYGNIFAVLATVIAVAVAPILFESFGYPFSAVLFSIIVALTILPMLTIKENPEYQEIEKISFINALRISFENHPYRLFLINKTAIEFGFRILNAILPFLIVSVIGLKLSEVFVISAFLFVGAFVSVVIWEKLSIRYGKKITYISTMVIFTIPLGLSWLFLILPAGAKIIFGIFFGLFGGIGMGGIWIISPVLIADIIDDEEKRIGLRRESMYYSMQEMLEKLAISGAIGLEGAILSMFWAGIAFEGWNVVNVYNPLGPVLMIGGIGFGAMIIAIISFLKFPKKISG
ncbi:MAG: MFS transporter [Candidatus Helarchaeota archaeon]